jgi:hypothetical protein
MVVSGSPLNVLHFYFEFLTACEYATLKNANDPGLLCENDTSDKVRIQTIQLLSY